MNKETFFAVQNLSVAYNGQTVVRSVSFSVRCGEILAIVGESGSGKSTVLKAAQGLLGSGGRVSGGRIMLYGRDIYRLSPAERRREIAGSTVAMIFQNAGASFCPIRTIGEQIYESVREHTDWSREEFTAQSKAVMKRINLPETVLNEFPFRLSGGMGQRAGILAAVILKPALLLADEPTSALDTVTQLSVVKELMELRRQQNIAIVIVTHNMGVAWYMADNILVMRDGEPVEYGAKEQIFRRPQAQYTKELIAAVPGLRL